MKKRILTLTVIASVLASCPAYSGFTIIQKSAPVAQSPASSYGSYSLIESDTPVIPVPASSAPPPMPSAALPTRSFAAPLQRYEQPLLTIDRLEEEGARIQAQIDRLRADLEVVKVALASARARKAGDATRINSKIDGIDERFADANTSTMRIRFDLNSTKFAPDSATARQLLLAAQNALRINIYGHADNTGTTTQNSIVAMSRAVSARNYLIQNGIHSRKINIVSRGATEPLADNNTADGRAKNRRVDVEFSNKPALAANSYP